MACARLVRGTSSRLNAVTPRSASACTTGMEVDGGRKLISAEPGRGSGDELRLGADQLPPAVDLHAGGAGAGRARGDRVQPGAGAAHQPGAGHGRPVVAGAGGRLPLRAAGRLSGQLPPLSAARSTMTDPGRIPATISSVTSTGARRPGMAAVVMTMSATAAIPG